MIDGGSPSGIPTGYFFAPTLFADVDNHSIIAREEVFGPIGCVIPHDTEEEGMALATINDWRQEMRRIGRRRPGEVRVGREFAAHSVVHHGRNEYVHYEDSTNHNEHH